MIKGHSDITDREYEKTLVPFFNNLDQFMIKYIIPEVVAFYLASSHYKNCLCDSSLYIHINSAMDTFNGYDKNIDIILPTVIELLKIKYGLKIAKNNPLILEKIV